MRNMIVVGSSGRTDGLSDFSNMGRRTVHLLSPGEGIMSTTYNGRYGPMDGTSMACPLVAGAAALLQSAALSRGVELSYAETRQLLLATVDPLPDSADATLTSGRLNIAAAMQALAVVMKARGMKVPPGAVTEGPAAEQLLQRLQASQWAAGLLPAAQAPTGSVSAASVMAPAVAGVQPPPMGRKRSRRRLSA